MKRLVLGALPAVAVVLLVACSPSRPKILQTFSQLNYVWDKGWEAPAEALAIFVQVENDDGLEELDALYVLSDAEEIYWKLERGNWTQLTRPGENWIGANQLTIPFRPEIPRGSYRVLLTTKAGERQSTTFSIDVVRLNQARPVWPQVAVVGDRLLVGNAPPSYALWLYGVEGNLLHQLVSNQASLALADIQSLPPVSQRATRTWLYWYNEKEGYGMLLGPFPLVEGVSE